MALPEERVTARLQPRIGRYVVTARIGKGGMGMVYRARDEALDRDVALKTLTAEGTSSAESRGRFQIEAKAAARLQHPNIVTVYELGEDKGLPFIAMELLPGVDLTGLARTPEGLLLEESLDMLIQVLRGLAYAHENGIVHRDVKPSNIRILDDGGVKLVDFGIAKLGETGITRTGMMVGTVFYMSPEQIRGGHVDGRSDLFSAGVILYELLSGSRPFRGGGTTEVLYKIVHEPVPPLESELGPHTEALKGVVARALAKSPEERFANASEMGAALATILAACAPAAVPLESDVVRGAERLLREGRPEDALARVEPLLRSAPRSLGARRVRRIAQRELERRAEPATDAIDAYPELDSTFRSEPTRSERQPGTTVLPEPGAVARSRPGGWLALGAVGLAAAGVAGALLLRGGAPPPPPYALSVRSEPTGASLRLDGQDTGLVTDATLSIPRGTGEEERVVTLVLRKQGYVAATRRVALPLAQGESLLVELERVAATLPVRTRPPGARVELDGEPVEGVTPLELQLAPDRAHRLVLSLDGHEGRSVEIAAEELPEAIDVSLLRIGVPGSLVVTSGYAVDVIWNGRVVSRGQAAARVSLPAGSQQVTLRSDEHFLTTTRRVEVPEGGEVGLLAPPLGRISIRAVPDNCEIEIDGRFADYPPILERPIASGEHTITFRWADGVERAERARVPADGIAYVTGRR